MYQHFKTSNGKLIKFSGNVPHVIVPDDVKKIGKDAFRGRDLNSVILSDGVTEIESWAFDGCPFLTSVILPDSVTKIKRDSFLNCPQLTIICQEGSYAHLYCQKNKMAFLFDYQFEAFHGVIPPGIEKLASPFLADEEKPYIFISYSHKDRDAILPIIKALYESGWKVWYDEGLTIGDRYDETLEEHVKNCSVFLLFVTERSINSLYVKENEIPWAIGYGKPIIRCNLSHGIAYEIDESAVVATVSPAKIEEALETVRGLTKGEHRIAKGITVAVDPAARNDGAGDGFACCLYAEKNASTARAILLEAKNSGCALNDTAEEGMDEGKLQDCACLIVFLDQAFLSDTVLTKALIDAYRSGKDIAICQLEGIGEDDLPPELAGLEKVQWLQYTHGITGDMNTKLARHLEKRGCRNAAVIPGFDYTKTRKGIVIQRYTGRDPAPRIEREYSGIPVIEIGKGAFKNCVQLERITLQGSVTAIEDNAFEGCSNLSSVGFHDGLARIGDSAFEGCKSLNEVVFPDSVTKIGSRAFRECEGLQSIAIPGTVSIIGRSAFEWCQRLKQVTISDGVKVIGDAAFQGCMGLISIRIPDSITEIGDEAFKGTGLVSISLSNGVTKIGQGALSHCYLESITLPKSLTVIEKDAFCCTKLSSIVIPDGVTKIKDGAFCACEKLASVTLPKGVTLIGYGAFNNCTSLTSITLPDGVQEIEGEAFSHDANLTSVTIPNSVERIGYHAFHDCPKLSVTCSRGSCAWKHCEENGIPVKAPDESSRKGLLGRLFANR